MAFRSWALVAMTLAFATPALADPTAQEKETARNLMDEGRDLRDDKKDPKGALERFKAADAIMHVPTTSIEVAATEVSLGMLVEAREVIAHILATQAQKGEPIQFREARKRAQALDDEIASRIPTLVVKLNKAQPGATVLIDGDALPPSLVGLPARANPGHHVIVASSKSMEGREEVDLKEGEKREVMVTLEPRGVEHETIAQEAPQKEAPPASKASGVRTFGFVVLGLGGASLVAGGVTGALTLTTQSDLATKCPNHVCGPESHDELTMANTLALVSTVTFIAGGVLAVTGLVSVLVGKPHAEPKPTARIVPWIGPGSAGLEGVF